MAIHLGRISRSGPYLSVFLTMVLAGMWHGAGWQFIVFGILHGSALVLHRIWKNSGFSLSLIPSWMLTFSFVSISLIFFRSDSLTSALHLVDAMFLGNGLTMPHAGKTQLIWAVPIMAGLLFLPNLHQFFSHFCKIDKPVPSVKRNLIPKWTDKLKWSPNLSWALVLGIMLAVSWVRMTEGTRQFLYFEF